MHVNIVLNPHECLLFVYSLHKGAPMSDRSYSKAVLRHTKALGIDSVYILHIGRGTAPVILEAEEVGGLDKRAIGNWATDVFGLIYDIKLPLPAMRAMAGHDSRRGFYVNPRSTFFGDDSHKHLPAMIFPWIDEQIDKLHGKTDLHTAMGFLSLLKSLRWVILQDAAVLLGENKRDHFIYQSHPEIFASPAFLDFQTKMLAHISYTSENDPNFACVETILPGVNNRLDTNNRKVDNVDNNVTELRSEFKDYRTESITVMKETVHLEIKETLRREVASNMNDICAHIGKFPVTHLPGVIQGGMNNEMTPFENEGTLVVLSQNYSIPDKFDTVKCMLNHWNNDVGTKDLSNDKSWRKHLSKAEAKRFSRVRRIVKAFTEQMDMHGKVEEEVLLQFETYYSTTKKSLAALSDKFAKNLLN